jgi:hypothetical protein
MPNPTGPAQSATPSSQSGAAAAADGSRYSRQCASASPAGARWTSNYPQRRALSAAGVGGAGSVIAGKPLVMPNPSFKPTRYGR